MSEKYIPIVEARKAWKKYVDKYGPYDLKNHPFIIAGSTNRHGDLCISYNDGEYRLFSQHGSIDMVIKWSDLNKSEA